MDGDRGCARCSSKRGKYIRNLERSPRWFQVLSLSRGQARQEVGRWVATSVLVRYDCEMLRSHILATRLWKFILSHFGRKHLLIAGVNGNIIHLPNRTETPSFLLASRRNHNSNARTWRLVVQVPCASMAQSNSLQDWAQDAQAESPSVLVHVRPIVESSTTHAKNRRNIKAIS
ncbi:hypothetical protein DL98DRAFT_241910 [Cadophora sp. DSE1049]|nr:hypothetical protein DL98DRAFT_241910 [Cadophora sp. DSE1049]